MCEPRSSCVQTFQISSFPSFFICHFQLPFITEPECFYRHQRKGKYWYHLCWAPGAFPNQSSSELQSLENDSSCPQSPRSPMYTHKQCHSRCHRDMSTHSVQWWHKGNGVSFSNKRLKKVSPDVIKLTNDL